MTLQDKCKFTSVKIPKVLAKQISDNCEKWGYRSVSDFVLFSARQKLREVTR